MIYYFTVHYGFYLLLHGLLENVTVIFDLLLHGLLQVFTRPSYFYTAHPRALHLTYYFTAYCGFHPPLLNLHGPPEGVILDLLLHG